MANRGESRITPDSVRNFDISPAASVVDKQGRYSPQLGDAGQLKATADGLAKLAKGMSDVDALMQRQANEQVFVAMAKTEEKNRKDCNEVFNKIEGMAKFNPYNKEAYKTLRAKANMEEGIYKLAELEATGGDLKYEEFEAHRQQIISETLANMDSEGLKARHKADYIVKLQNQSFLLKDKFVTKKAEQDYQILQNQMISSTSKDIATLTYLNPNGYIDGWNEAIKRLEEVADSVGMDSTKKKELLEKTINQYLVDNVDDIDAEEFMIALGQTKIGGQPLSDFDPNYATTMKQMLVKAKGAKYESDSMDLKIEKLRLEKAELEANKEMLAVLADPNKTDDEILAKAQELIQMYGLESVGGAWLQRVASNKQTLLNLRTTQTKPEIFTELKRKSIVGTLTQEDVISAMDKGQLAVLDGENLIKGLEAEAKENYSADLAAIKDLYLDANPIVELTDKQKSDLTQMVYEARTNPDLTKVQRAEAISRAKNIAEGWARKEESFKKKDPNNLLKAEYVNRFKIQDQSKREAQQYLAKMGLFRNQLGFKDGNIHVTSAMQQEREVTLANGQVVKRRHNGTDISTYLGRQIVAPADGQVIASGYEPTMGNYVLFKYNDGGYIKLMHLQSANLPKAGTVLKEGQGLGHVGNTGSVTTKNAGILHIECFDTFMRLVDPKKFIKG